MFACRVFVAGESCCKADIEMCGKWRGGLFVLSFGGAAGIWGSPYCMTCSCESGTKETSSLGPEDA